MARYEYRKLKVLMFEHNISQFEMAKKLGIAVSTLNRKLNGQCEWKLSECQMIAEMFDMQIEDIFFKNKVAKKRRTGTDG
ncbi:MAG: helix-turn-helix transcriptional regulator [Thermoanaerobacteraceae bacterium]|nr:helix-turn-helix transcriptional regulator [Thermoanaerobacteraceae bacterium]